MNLDLVAVSTRPCIGCHKESIVNVPRSVVEKMQDGYSVQEAWPYSTPQDREYLITGTHPECWENMFGGSDCD